MWRRANAQHHRVKGRSRRRRRRASTHTTAVGGDAGRSPHVGEVRQAHGHSHHSQHHKFKAQPLDPLASYALSHIHPMLRYAVVESFTLVRCGRPSVSLIIFDSAILNGE